VNTNANAIGTVYFGAVALASSLLAALPAADVAAIRAVHEKKTMKTSVVPLRGAVLSALAFVATAPGLSLAAQSKAAAGAMPGQLLEISVVIIKPDKTAEYERLQKEEVNPALKKAGWEARAFFKGGFLNDGYLYGTAVPIKSFAFFDEPRPLEKALGKPAADALMARIAACHISKRVFATRTVPDLSWGQLFSPVAVVVTNRLAPGRKSEYLKFLREHLVPVIRKSDILGFTVEEHVLGGSSEDVTTLGFWRNYADLDKGSAARHVLGEQAYEKLLQKLPIGVVLGREASVIEFREDLSFGPLVKMAQMNSAGDPWIGTWVLNVAKSRFSPGPAPKSETRTYVVTAAGERASYTQVDAEGKQLRSESTYTFDGKDAPVTGLPDSDTFAFKRTGPSSLAVTVKKAGKVARTATRVVSTDGKTLTLTIKGTNAKGQPLDDTWVFDRR
ncbi:MAG: hypothetical protein Q7S40_06020, partial [Opitutaceae bacterium]|nr:hypothetical protein [Opitutaceae bacterium]